MLMRLVAVAIGIVLIQGSVIFSALLQKVLGSARTADQREAARS